MAPEQTASRTPPERPKVQTRRCQIRSNGAHERRAEWSGPCEFAAEATSSDSFSVTGAGRAELLPGVLSISVHVLDSGEAEVRGLTTQGINSRWGDAIPDPDNASCWKGSDFRVCVQPNHPQEE